MKARLSSNPRWLERVGWWEQHLPHVDEQPLIPRDVHQVFIGSLFSDKVRTHLDVFAARNADWTFHLYDEAKIERFLHNYYDDAVLRLFHAIDADYAAARADLFRYLLIYAVGGVYLDLKSRFTIPISTALTRDEGFVLAQWRNGPGQPDAGSGLHPDLADIPGGEFQQWHVIAAPGHSFLRAVLTTVLANVETYSPWQTNVGRIGVLRMTGPIAYTRAIAPLLDCTSHYTRIADEAAIGLEYAYFNQSHVFGRRHYSELTTPLVRRGWIGRASGAAFQLALAAQQRLR